MYDHEAKWDDSYFYNDVAVPQNTNATGTSHELNGANGQVEIVLRVGSTALSLANTQIITIKVQDSADDATFADVHTIYTKTFGASETIAVDTVLERYTPPTDIRKYVRVHVNTDDAAAVGKLKAFVRTLAS